ncbi:MAG: ATP-binding protein [Bacteroidaceae bacterium]|nr:ATP-binding protein [Bacteroidaceae bacterium]
MAGMRKYPAGVQSFEEVRTKGYVYVDKTPYIYKLLTLGKPYFLSRPRRFGKSLLISTLQAVFEGRRELFEEISLEDGIVQPRLFIATTDWKWEKYPVLRFDFSQVGKNEQNTLDEYIDKTLSEYEELYVDSPSLKAFSNRLSQIIKSARSKTGKKVVVLVDEYDNQMLKAIGDVQKVEAVRNTFMGLFSPLKGLDDHLQFIFITGISKFSQMGIFSQLNNLNNISMWPDYEGICGITEEELTTTMREDIELLAARRKQTYDELLDAMKKKYDGYHFCSDMTDIYNPYSVVKAFASGKLGDYWFESATPTALIAMLSQMPAHQLLSLEGSRCPETAFNLSFDSYKSPLPVLYQSGYLTIKNYRADRNMYTLGFPNEEVRLGFADNLFRLITNMQPDNEEKNVFLDAYYDFRDSGDLPAFIEAIKTFFAGIPYYLDNKNETHYHVILHTLLTAFGADISSETPSAKGRADMELRMPLGIYVIEFKYDDTVDAALQQIDDRGYAEKYRLDGRPVVKVGISFSSEDRNITDWKSVAL